MIDPNDPDVRKAAEAIRARAPEGSLIKESSLEEICEAIPEAIAQFATEFGIGVSVLSPEDARELLRGQEDS
jgi:hypothetical protein